MKKYISICIFFAFLCTHLFAQQEVTLDEIRTASAHYLSVYHPSKTFFSTSNIVSVSYITRQEKPAIYEVLYQNGNTILLSGSKACIPVLGCNFSGNIETIVGNDDLPFGLQDMLDGMLMDIDSALLNDTITLYHQAEWDELLSADYLNIKNTAEQHGPLLTSKWGQSTSNDGGGHAYNYYITKTSSSCSGYCSAGCVAVAMAQVLYYWKHPWNRGVYTYYDWCNMPDALIRHNNSRYEAERDAVAKLVYDCGISVGMDYCSDGCSSSARTKEAQNALRYDFMFNTNADYRKKGIRLTKNWIKFIKKDIDCGRPIIYRGQGSGGHAFVCDGYRDGDLFHFNWGWNGSYNNTWLTVKDITPGSSNYSKRQAAIFEIYPDASYVNYCNAQVNLLALYNLCSTNGITDFWNIVPSTGKILESCDQNITPSAWRTIPAGEISQYIAFEQVILNPGFTAEEGSLFTASIRECPNCIGITKLKNEYTEAEMGLENQEEFSNKTSFIYGLDSNNSFTIFPNPSNGVFSIKTTLPNLPYNVIIRSMLGQAVYEKYNIGTELFQVDISGKSPDGIYLIEIQFYKNKKLQKIIIQKP